MSRQYSPKTFLRQVPNSILKQYFEQRNIQIGLDGHVLGERYMKAVFAVLEQLAPADFPCQLPPRGGVDRNWRVGPAREVPGRKGMSYTEEDGVDEDATSHRGADD